MVVYGELDPPNFIEQAKLMGAALCKANRCSSLLRLPKHSHMSEVYAINTPDKSLSDPILVFVKGGRVAVIPEFAPATRACPEDQVRDPATKDALSARSPALRATRSGRDDSQRSVHHASRAAWPRPPAAS